MHRSTFQSSFEISKERSSPLSFFFFLYTPHSIILSSNRYKTSQYLSLSLSLRFLAILKLSCKVNQHGRYRLSQLLSLPRESEFKPVFARWGRLRCKDPALLSLSFPFLSPIFSLSFPTLLFHLNDRMTSAKLLKPPRSNSRASSPS